MSSSRSLAVVPTSDLVEFRALPEAVQREVELWLAVLGALRGRVGDGLADIARRMGVSNATARRKWDCWRRDGWRGLVNRAKLPATLATDRGLPPVFVEHVRARFGANQRKMLPAYRALIEDWRRGVEIPGYEAVSAFERATLPAGWSYDNLIRVARPSDLELVVRRVGMGAAKAMLPQVFTTRVGLWPGAMLMLDDVWHDHFAVFRGKPVRVLQLSMLDVFSGCVTAYGTKPRWERDDGSHDQLKEAQTCYLVAQQLFLHGYSEQGTTLLAEHGTAAVREDLARLLHDRTGGKIMVRRSGITGQEQAICGMMDGRGGGNFRFKSALESLHNLFHNELGALPGQAGMDVAHRPEQLDGGVMRMTLRKDGKRELQLGGLLSHVTDLGAALALLPASVAAKLRMPLLNYEAEFRPVLRDTMEWINRRGEWAHFTHDLEGWAECGHVVTEYRATAASDHWLGGDEFLALPPAEQQLFAALARSNAATYSRTRKLSPREVWGRGRGELTRINPVIVPEILTGGRPVTDSPLAQERVCRNCYFEFSDAEISDSTLRYAARLQRPDGREEELRDGTYLTLLNPYNPEFLWIHDARGGLLGLVRRDHRAGRADVEAVERKFGEAAKRTAERLAELKVRNVAESRAAAKRMAANAEALGEPGRERERLGSMADDALDDVFGDGR